MNKKFLATTFTLTGSIIGAGILGLPYVFAQSGLLIGLFWLVALGAIIIFMNLTLGEITLRTKGKHQLTGYAEKYLGKKGKRAMFLIVMFGIYSALLAYLIGEGNSFAKIIPFNIPPVIFGIAFWLILTLILKKGLKGLKKIETWGVFGIIALVVGIFIRYVPTLDLTNLAVIDTTNFFTPIGVVLFALLGFVSIPELRKEINGQEKLFKKAIFFGTGIPIVLYILFSIVFIGKFGVNVNEVATLSLGPFVTILGIFTMLTSFLVLSYALHDIFRYDLKTSKKTDFFFTSIFPLILYILAEVFNFTSFSTILGIGGTVSGGLTGIMILLMAKKAKVKTRNKGKEPEINMPINWPIIIILSLVFITGIILELF